MPDGFVKVVLRGTASTQNIVNLLYYGNEDGDPIVGINSAFLQSFAARLATYLDPDWGAGLADSYTLNQIECWAVNERQQALDVQYWSEPVSITGLRAAATDTPSMYCVMRMLNAIPTGSSYHSVERSYIAYGPLTSTDIDNDGYINAAAQLEIAVAAVLLDDPIDIGVEVFAPVRIGRTVAPNQVHFGRVSNVVFQQYCSSRKSRRRRPNGT